MNSLNRLKNWLIKLEKVRMEIEETLKTVEKKLKELSEME